jgi:hypothetical protein
MKQAAENNESFGYTEEEIVSSDIIGSHFGSIYDATQLEVAEAGERSWSKPWPGTITSTVLSPSSSACWINLPASQRGGETRRVARLSAFLSANIRR